MKRVLKWIGIIFAVLLSVLVLAVLGLSLYASSKFKPTLKDRPLAPIVADTSSEGMARGKYFFL